jgi:hypothetical protein
MDPAINNPLYGLELGSTVSDLGGFGATVVKPSISKFDGQQSWASSMSGTSSYVYSSQMNQGTFSVAGSYGLSGVSKVSGAVAGYVGNATANSDSSLDINANLIKWAGIQYIALNDLNPAELIAGFAENVQTDLNAVLDAYIAMIREPKHQKLVDAWVDASFAFNSRWGAGLVVGVLWGGWGTVSLTFSSSSSESKWEGGGSAKFSYVSDTAAVDVAATYGHSEDSIGKDAKGQVAAFANGACVDAIISTWRDDLQKIADAGLQALGKEPLISSSALTSAVSAPPIPGFEKPTPSEGVAKKITSIDSLDGLKAYAVASAYDKYKKDGGKDTLDEFMKSADETNDVSEIPELPKDDDSSDSEGGESHVAAASDRDEALTVPPVPAGREAVPADSTPPTSADMSDFEPLGVWTVGWGQLFPWLVTGHDNRVPKDASYQDTIALRTLLQDCLSLSGLYARLAGAGATLTVKGDPVEFTSIADAFVHVAATIADFLAVSKPAEVLKGASGKLSDALTNMGPDAKAIYETWTKVPELRKCELGAGITFSAPYWGSKKYTISGLKQGLESFAVTLVETDFDYTAKTFSAFGPMLKAWPVVLPDKRIAVFVSNGVKGQSGFLAAWILSIFTGGPIPEGANVWVSALADSYGTANSSQSPNTDVTVPNQDGNVVVFDAATTTGASTTGDTGPGYLTGYYLVDDGAGNQDVGVCSIYPIPFSAADGESDWLGTSLTTGMGDLPEVLDTLRANLGALNQWTLDDASWDGVDWASYRYSVQGLRPTYTGVVPEVHGIFSSTQTT